MNLREQSRPLEPFMDVGLGPAQRQTRHELVPGESAHVRGPVPGETNVFVNVAFSFSRVVTFITRKQRRGLRDVAFAEEHELHARAVVQRVTLGRAAARARRSAVARDANFVHGAHERRHAFVQVQARLGGGDDGSRGARDENLAAFDVARREHAHPPRAGRLPQTHAVLAPLALQPRQQRRAARDATRVRHVP